MTNPAPEAAKVTPVPSVALATRPTANAALGTWATEANFALAQRAATALSASDLVPKAYQGKPANCLIAIDISYHLGISPLTVMQNLHIIHGRPSWGSPFIIGALNSCGRFSPLRFKMDRKGRKSITLTTWSGSPGNRTPKRETIEIDEVECLAYANELATGEKIEGPVVSMGMAYAEGWYTKAESKWVTMPDLMLRYRAAAFFGRLYAPDILMGMHTAEEVLDIVDETKAAKGTAGGALDLQRAIEEAAAATTSEPPQPEPNPSPGSDAPAAATPEPSQPTEPVVIDDPKPTPSKYAAKAIEKEAAGGKLSDNEAESARNYRLDLEEWQSRQPKQGTN